FGPEVDDNRNSGFEHFALKIGGVYFHGCHAGHSFGDCFRALRIEPDANRQLLRVKSAHQAFRITDSVVPSNAVAEYYVMIRPWVFKPFCWPSPSRDHWAQRLYLRQTQRMG